MMNIREFKHCWDEYLNEKEQTHMQIWELFLNKMSYKTQILLLKIANKYYGDEAKKSFENAILVDKMVKEHIAKNKQK